jgi:multidrug efflux pump subunit AcrB
MLIPSGFSINNCPIMMATIAALLGTLPLVLAVGAGAELRGRSPAGSW